MKKLIKIPLLIALFLILAYVRLISQIPPTIGPFGPITTNALFKKAVTIEGNLIVEGSTSLAALALPDTDASHELSLVWDEDDSANRILNFQVDGGNRTIELKGDLTLWESFTVGDGYNGTLTFSAASKVLTVATTNTLDQSVAVGSSPDFDAISMTPTLQVTQSLINMVPGATIGSSVVWKGINVNGAALDPSASGAEIYALYADYSGVSLTNEPDIEAVYIVMPTTYSGQSDLCAFEAIGNGITVEIIDNDKGQNAIYVDGGEVSLNYQTGSAVAASYQSMNIAADVDDLDTNSLFHFINFQATGSTSGEVAAIGTNEGVMPIHQHIGSFATPNQTNYAARFPNGGSWTAGIDGNQIFVADDDEIYIGDTAVFSQLELILTTPSSKDIKAEFYYYNTSTTWIEFFPTDNTDGFTQDGIISWDSGDFTSWKSDYNPGGGGAGYFIKVKRTRVIVATPPTPTTIKILAPTTYEWDESGDLEVNDIVADSFISSAVTAATPSGAFTVNWTTNLVHQVTITGTTLDITFTNPSGPCFCTLVVIQGDGDDTIDWTNEADILWPGGVAPTLSTGAADVDIVKFYFDGTSYYGLANLDFQ